MKEKNEMSSIFLVVKTSDRVSSSGSEETLMDRSSFVFELGSKLCSYCFPNRYLEVFQELQGRPLYEEKSPQVKESLSYPSYPGLANISYIFLPKLGV